MYNFEGYCHLNYESLNLAGPVNSFPPGTLTRGPLPGGPPAIATRLVFLYLVEFCNSSYCRILYVTCLFLLAY